MILAKTFEYGKQYLYSLAILTTIERKTCTNLSKYSGSSHDRLYRELNIDSELPYKKTLREVAQKKLRADQTYLIIDDSRINKDFAHYIEGLSEDLDGSSGRITKGLQMVTSMLTDLRFNIPILLEPLLNKWICPEKYKKKSEVAWQIISKITSDFDIKMVLADAHYATKDLLDKLQRHFISFLMKIPRNRKVTINHQYRQLQEILRLRRNERVRCEQGFYNNLPYWFYVVKVSPHITVYLVSSDYLNPKDVLNIYRIRWKIEEFHRTSKQYLGLANCQSRSLQKQIVHCLHVMQSYIIADAIRDRLELRTIEQAIRAFREPKTIPRNILNQALRQELRIIA